MFSFSAAFNKNVRTRVTLPDVEGTERPYSFVVDGATDAKPETLDKLVREEEALSVSRKGFVDEHGIIHRPRSVMTGEVLAENIAGLRKYIDEQKKVEEPAVLAMAAQENKPTPTNKKRGRKAKDGFVGPKPEEAQPAN